MASKKSRGVAAPTPVEPLVGLVPPVSQALAELLSLTAPIAAATSATATSNPAEGTDLALQGATLAKNVVKLGLDPKVASVAARAVRLRAILEARAAMFADVQKELRTYGKAKRDAYNAAMRRDIVTVSIPYFARVPKDAASETPGRELRYVQVICASTYSVNKDTVLRMETELGDAFKKLFVTSEAKYLKQDAEGLFKQILKDLGVPEDRIAPTMGVLFETTVRVSANDNYEAEHKKLPEKTRAILDVAVVRQQPSLRFP
jgi:hypothetical protein